MNSLTSIPSGKQCHRELFKLVWGAYTCPKCGSKLLFRSNYEWCRKCRLKSSVKSETNFKHSNLSYQQIYLIIWCWQQKKSVGTIRDIVGISYPTINKWLTKLRGLLPRDQTKLSGIVEMDESFFGRMRFKTKLKSGEVKSFKLVVGAIESDTRRVRLSMVQERDRETLEQFVLENITAGSHINTDAWGAYSELYLLGYTHDICNHSIGHFGPTNHIENLWGVIKRHLRSVYANRLNFSAQELNLILNEWQIRHNRPALMYNVSNYLNYAACSGLFK